MYAVSHIGSFLKLDAFIHDHTQLCLSWSYAAVSYTEQLMVYVREFNITVETVERFFPKLKPEVDKLFYDAKSLILAYNSELCIHTYKTNQASP